jgi:hypothetical protein
MSRCAGDPWTGLAATAAAAGRESSRLMQCACRTAAPWYDFQELRYACSASGICMPFIESTPTQANVATRNPQATAT